MAEIVGAENVLYKIDGTTLTLTIDLSKTLGLSKSEKSILIGTTHGNKKVDYQNDKITVSVNIYKPKPETEA